VYYLDGTTIQTGVISPFTITGIYEQTTFYVGVMDDILGNVYSDPASGTPYYVGSIPIINSVTPDVNSLIVNFSQNDSGNPLPVYSIYNSSDGSIIASNITSPYTITDISATTTFYIDASNIAGNFPSDPYTETPYYVGNSLAIDSVTPDVNSLIVNFSQTNLGYPSPTFNVYYSDGSLIASDITSPYTITAISEQKTFYIESTNTAGNLQTDDRTETPYYVGGAPLVDSYFPDPNTNNATITFYQPTSGNPNPPTYYYSSDGSSYNYAVTSPFNLNVNEQTTFYIFADSLAGNIRSGSITIDPQFYDNGGGDGGGGGGPTGYFGSSVIIDSITSGINSVEVAFHQNDVGYPPALYYYSYDGYTSGYGSSPFTISGLYGQITFFIFATNDFGSTSTSDTGNPYYVTSPVIDSITSGTSSFTVYFHHDDVGNPPAEYYYSLDGTTILGTGIASSPLTISDISGTQTINIVAQNTAGNAFSTSSQASTLYVGSTPVIDSITSGVNSLTVNFHQDDLGNPPANYFYSFDGTTRLGTGIASSPLTISDISGTKTVYIIAHNTAGDISSISSQATPLYVGTKPVIDTVIPGTNKLTVIFHQDVSGNPLPTYYYSLNGTTLLGTGTSSSPLVISNIYNTTTFYIVAQNSAGTQRSNTTATGNPISNVPCFGENSKILCFNQSTHKEEYIAIKNIKRGDLVKTARHGYVGVYLIGRTQICNDYADNDRNKNRLYRLSKRNYPEMIEEDLILTGCHSILVDDFKNDAQRQKTIEVNNDIYVTDCKYRLPACVDERASIYKKSGMFTIYHLALDNNNYYMNYGIYANGLLVETCSKRYMRELSNMEFC